MIEIKLTPNRGDCFGVHGIARDLAAAGLGTAASRATVDAGRRQLRQPGPAIALDFPTATRRPARCSSAGISAACSNGPSPAWLQDRLKAIGLRPISALVDITNFVTFDLGRPLHVFDAGKLAGDIVAAPGAAGREAAGARRQDLRARPTA